MTLPATAGAACPVCGAKLGRRWATFPREAELFRCGACRADFSVWSPEYAPVVAPHDHFAHIDPTQYEQSVGATRRRSFDRWLKRVRRHSSGGAWLDVGCSFGWLLKKIAGTEFDGHGIEPSPGAAAEAIAAGCKVQQGLFPNCEGSGKPYAVISFFDVLEHFADPLVPLAAARRLLAPNGLVVIQAPDQSCLLYRLAEILYRCGGARGAFALRRLWLAGFDFPHCLYLNAQALAALLQRSGFHVLEIARDPIGSPFEAVQRVGYAQPGKRLKNVGLGLAVGAIQACDALTGYGGLLCAIARVNPSHPTSPVDAG